MRGKSIRTKLALLMSVLIGAIALVIFLYVPARLREQSVRSLVEESYNVTDMAAYSVAPGLLANSRESVAEALWTLRTNPRLAYVMVHDRNGGLQASFNERIAEAIGFREVPMQVRQSPLPRGRAAQTRGGFDAKRQIYQTHTPVFLRGQRVGSIYIGMSMRPMYAEIARSREAIALVSLIVFVLGVVAAFLLSAAVTRSLRKIVDTAEQIAGGDIDQRSEVVSGDEVGQLSRSFNTMVDRLQTAQEELAGLNVNLEQRVADRTRALLDETSIRQRAEEAARLSDQRHRQLFDRNLAGIYVRTLQGRVLSCNDAFARMIGYDSSEEFLAAERIIRYAHPDAEAALLEELMRKGSVSNHETQLLTRQGSAIWVLENVIRSEQESSSPVLEAIVLDITARKSVEQDVEFRANHDSLTQLPNRAMFKEELARVIAAARIDPRNIAVMFIDVDDLKVVNDTLGHLEGDQLLARVGQRLEFSAGKDALVARVGGDEFTILLLEANDDAGVGMIAAALVNAFHEPFILGDDEIRVTISLGVALFPDDGEDPDSIIVNADRTMYRVKEAGGNGYQFCSRIGARRGLSRFTLEQSLRRALEREEFCVYYQPQVSFSTSEITGMEALVRWNHPDGMLIEPGGFIPLAEYVGLILPIGDWVLRESCRQMRQWSDMGLSHLRVGVNLSARQFHQRDFLGTIRRALEDSGLNPEQLEIEITETMVMQTTEWTVGILRQIREMGIGIAMDDFGTGQSSLGNLKKFPVNALKIDRSFIRDLGEPSHDAAIVDAILLLCNSLGLRTVAEGVETAEQYEILRDAFCGEMQGYFFSRPIPAAQMERLLIPEKVSPALAANPEQP